MATLVYGSIQLNQCETLSYSREAIWDGPSYLYTKHTIHIRAVYAPLDNSYQSVAGANAVDFPIGTRVPVNPVNNIGNVATITDVAIRHALMQPRQKLIYIVGGANAQQVPQNLPAIGGGVLGFAQVAAGLAAVVAGKSGPLLQGGLGVLISPPPLLGGGFASVDAYIGPRPVFCNVVEIVGSKTFIVEYIVETWVSECYLYESTPPTILSLNWRMHHSSGPETGWLTQRTITGRAVFNAAAMATDAGGPFNADDFRAYIFHPVPDAFQRSAIDVTATEDGAAVEYVVRDDEKHFVVFSDSTENPCTIESTHSARLYRPSLEQFLPPLWAFGGGTIATILKDVRFDLGIAEIAPFGWIGDLWTKLSRLVASGVPPVVEHIIAARVQGNRLTTRDAMYTIGKQIVANRVANLPATVGAAAGLDSNVKFNNLGRDVEVVCKFSTGPFTAALGGLATITAGIQFPGMPTTDTMTGITSLVGAQPLPPGDFVSRGTYLAECVANALMTQCQKISTPNEPGRVGIEAVRAVEET